MTGKSRIRTAAVILAACALSSSLGAPARAEVQVTAGWLTCNVGSGWGWVIGSSRNISCVYSPTDGTPQRYAGQIKKFGVDIGYLSAATMKWAVLAPTTDPSPGALTGDYLGATAAVSLYYGAGANVLFGGFDRSVALQPVSVEGNQGLDVAGGVGAVSLAYQP